MITKLFRYKCNICLVVLLLVLLVCFHTTWSAKYKFALCAKSIDNPFFDVSRDGCVDRAMELSAMGDDEVECIYSGPTVFNPNGSIQGEMVSALLDEVDGLSISIRNATVMRPIIQLAIDKGLPVVTFDSDDVWSARASYIGTDNFFFGDRLGKVLRQIKPRGGTFGIISDTPTNIIERERGLLHSLLNESNAWTQVEGSPTYDEGNATLAIEQIRQLIKWHPNITAIIPVMGAPMFLKDEWKSVVRDFPNVTFVVADGLPVQLELLGQTYVHGLVSQLPYEMGAVSMDSLLALKKNQTLPVFQGTNLLEHLQIPLTLPDLVVDNNYLGNLRFLGYILYGIVASTAIAFGGWTWINRNVRVVAVAQPYFLLMVAFGSLVMATTIIPLSFDDSSDDFTTAKGTWICMSSPWFVCLGFTIVFSALFAKTKRINTLFKASKHCQRIQVTAREVLTPFFMLFTANVVVLLAWTLLDPMHFVRVDTNGTDAWNRVIETYGACQAGGRVIYASILCALDVGMLGFANYEAYRARQLKGDFAESRYIGLVFASILQGCLIGVPLLILVEDNPQARYTTMTIFIFIVTMVVLLFIFVPKMKAAQQSEVRQMQRIKSALRKNSKSRTGNHALELGASQIASNAEHGGSRVSDVLSNNEDGLMMPRHRLSEIEEETDERPDGERDVVSAKSSRNILMSRALATQMMKQKSTAHFLIENQVGANNNREYGVLNRVDSSPSKEFLTTQQQSPRVTITVPTQQTNEEKKNDTPITSFIEDKSIMQPKSYHIQIETPSEMDRKDGTDGGKICLTTFLEIRDDVYFT